MQQGNENPYQAPASIVADAPMERVLVDAGKWRRFFKWVLDYIAIIGVVVIMTILAVLAGGDGALQWVEDMGFWQEKLLGIGALFAYYTVMEGMFGLTFGKLVTRTRVVDEHGAPPTWRQAVLRSLARMIPFEPFSLLFSEDGVTRGWHDRLPRTRVVLRTPVSPAGKQASVAA